VTYALRVRKRALLALSLPLAAVGSLAGHAAGYALAGTTGQDARIHGYLAFAPQFLAACAAAVAIALALRISGRLQGRPAAWPFALFPPLAFVVQELIERFTAGLPAHAVFEPGVYAGLAVQLPIALLAYLAGRALLRVADTAAVALATRPPLSLRPAPLLLPATTPGPAASPLVYDRLGRAPPR
jgi:hypothetical protein